MQCHHTAQNLSTDAPNPLRGMGFRGVVSFIRVVGMVTEIMVSGFNVITTANVLRII